MVCIGEVGRAAGKVAHKGPKELLEEKAPGRSLLFCRKTVL